MKFQAFSKLFAKRQQLKQTIAIVLVALCLFGLVAGAASAQGATVQHIRSLLVELSATVNQNLTVGQDVTVGDDLTVTDSATINGATQMDSLTGSNWVKITAPTAIATATPAMVVNSAGVSRLLELQKNATPVFSVNGAGVVTGGVLQYPTPGLKQICGSSTITGTGALAHGLSTPSYVQVSLNTDMNGDHARVSSTNSGGTVTAKVWNSALTPVAAQTPVTVDWCVIGTP